jgi:DNA repair exonuclease SbcCD ATPase subunit
MIIFEKIRFKNILSFGNTWTEIFLNSSPVTLIQGKNGSGKSAAILDTICFALFGKPFRKINKPQLVNFRNRKEMLVEIYFTKNEVPFLIRRGQNPQVFEIYKNGELLNQTATIRDYQDWLEKNVLQFDYNAFTQIVILGKATFVSFMRLSLDQRRKFVENILNLNIFSIMSEIQKGALTQLKERIDQIKNQIKITKERKSIHETYIRNLKKDLTKKQTDDENLIKNELKAIEKELRAIDKKIESLHKKKNDIDLENKSNFEFKIHRTNELILKARVKLSDVKKIVEFFENHEHCPTCFQAIPQEAKISYIDTNTKSQKELTEIIEKLHKELEKFTEKLRLIERLNAENSQINKSIDELLYSKNALISQKDKISNQKTPDVSHLEKRIEEEETKLEAITKEYEEQLTVRGNLLDDFEYYELVAAMLKDSGIKKVILSKFMPQINSLINTNLRKLGFSVKLVFNEDFSETILSRGIDELSYFNYSEGEKLRIDLAILMAWRDVARLKNNMYTNLMIFDEILDSSLEKDGIEAFLQMLGDSSDMNVFFITHNPDKMISHKIKEYLFFEKQGGFSKLLKNTYISE